MSDCVIDEGIGRSHNTFPPLKQLQKRWEVAVAEALEPVAAYDPSRESGRGLEVPFEELSAARAIKHPEGARGVDFRPHIFDSNLKSLILCDSGSQICAWPPDPGDQPVPGLNLKAVNGSVLKCYGNKQISIQIGRKQYHYQAVKADVASPILGWDFFRHYKLGFRWNRWGDIELFDRKANISQVLKFKSLPHP